MKLEFTNPTPHMLVIGDLMIDHYLWGSCERISPEAPVQVLDVQHETSVLGGAGNVVNNLIALGAKVEMATVVGDDAAGEQSLDMLAESGVATNLIVRQAGRKSSRKSRLMGGHQQVLRFDKESKDPITDESAQALIAGVESRIAGFDIVFLSDYGKGVLTHTVCQAIIQTARAQGVPVLVDPKGTDYTKYRGATTLTPNKKEASLATGLPIKTEDDLERAGFWLKQQVELDFATITLSEDGIACFTDAMHHLPTRAKDVYDVTGAGDTVLAAMGYCLANGWDVLDAARFANLAAAVVVGKVGSATATVDEVDAFYSASIQPSSARAVKLAHDMAPLVQRLQAEGKKVVFTNGCFDVLHLGHVKLLEASKGFGDVLIVGLNADASVKRLKGPERPINKEDDRAYLLAALQCVDYVVLFEEDTPYELIARLRPDVLVKGADYTVDQVIGHELVKEVKLVNLIEGKSTTSIVNRIKETAR